jgi:hypothetical protein
MKKIIFVFSILAVALFAFSVTGSALAAELQRGGAGNTGGAGSTGGVVNNGGAGNGGASGNQGDLGTGTGVPVEQNIALEGILEDLIHENLATALGISPAELTARLDAGETLSEIGLSLGFDLETLSEILTQARTDALAQAVATGLIPQEQADWLASHGNQGPAASYGEGTCDSSEDCFMDGAPQNTMSKSGYRGDRRR